MYACRHLKACMHICKVEGFRVFAPGTLVGKHSTYHVSRLYRCIYIYIYLFIYMYMLYYMYIDSF